jgi:hypothetical protein
MTTLPDHPPEDNDGRAEGERLRDRALDQLEECRPNLLRRLQRALLLHLLAHGPDTSDSIRNVVPIPTGTDPRVVGAAVRGLAEQALIRSTGRQKTRRPVAHARKLDVWAISDSVKAAAWLATHPEPEPVTDPDDPFAV